MAVLKTWQFWAVAVAVIVVVAFVVNNRKSDKEAATEEKEG